MCDSHDHPTEQLSDIWAGLDGTLDEGREEQTQDMRGKFTDAIQARQYIRAGKATVTLVSTRTGARFTYRVNTPEDKATGKRVTDGTLMVSVLNGPDNTSSYKWLGRVSRDIFWVGRKNPQAGEIRKDAACAKAFDFAWRVLLRGSAIPEGLEIWHEGRCGRCGRKLTVPESVARGFGPECADRVGL